MFLFFGIKNETFSGVRWSPLFVRFFNKDIFLTCNTYTHSCPTNNTVVSPPCWVDWSPCVPASLPFEFSSTITDRTVGRVEKRSEQKMVYRERVKYKVFTRPVCERLQRSEEMYLKEDGPYVRRERSNVFF